MSPSLPPPLPSSTFEDTSSGIPRQYNFNSNVMIAAMLLLCIVVLFVVSLHVYAKWFWRQGRRGGAVLPLSNTREYGALWRRRWRIPEEVDGPLVPAISVGLDSATVSSLPTFVYGASKSHDAGIREPLLECAVCLSEFQENEKGRLLPNCKHSFHIECIDMWFLSHSTCPLCREPVSPWPGGPQHQAADENAPSRSDYAPPPAQSLTTTAYLQNDQIAVDLSLQNSSSSQPSQCPPQPTTAIAPLLPLQYGNSGRHVQAELHQVGLAKNIHEADAHREFRSSCLRRDYSTGSGPSSSVEIQLGQGAEPGAAIARCQSLPRCQSDQDREACSPQPAVKSWSFRMSIKRLLSRDGSRAKGRIFPAGGAGDAGAEQDHPEVGEHSSVRR